MTAREKISVNELDHEVKKAMAGSAEKLSRLCSVGVCDRVKRGFSRLGTRFAPVANGKYSYGWPVGGLTSTVGRTVGRNFEKTSDGSRVLLSSRISGASDVAASRSRNIICSASKQEF